MRQLLSWRRGVAGMVVGAAGIGGAWLSRATPWVYVFWLGLLAAELVTLWPLFKNLQAFSLPGLFRAGFVVCAPLAALAGPFILFIPGLGLADFPIVFVFCTVVVLGLTSVIGLVGARLALPQTRQAWRAAWRDWVKAELGEPPEVYILLVLWALAALSAWSLLQTSSSGLAGLFTFGGGLASSLPFGGFSSRLMLACALGAAAIRQSLLHRAERRRSVAWLVGAAAVFLGVYFGPVSLPDTAAWIVTLAAPATQRRRLPSPWPAVVVGLVGGLVASAWLREPLRTLAKAQADRFATAGDFAHALGAPA